MKTIFVLIDALKSSYLTKENMPYLWDMAQNGKYVEEVYPSPGFCERSEIFSGLSAFESGNYTAIGYLPEYSPYKNIKILLSILDTLSSIHPIINRIIRYIFNKYRIKSERRLNPYLIPFRSLSNFALTEDGNHRLINHEDIFFKIKESGLTYTEDFFTSLSDLCSRTNKDIIDFAKEKVAYKIDFIPLYIGTTDIIGHRYGGDIDSIKPYLQQVDKQIKELSAISKTNDYALVILGDHGMVPVVEYIDIGGTIKTTGLHLHKDYEMFLDSTYARFWYNDIEVGYRIKNKINESFCQYGLFVDISDKDLPLDIISSSGHRVYGDLLWCANPGVLVSPDFFHNNKAGIKGMHGYLCTQKQNGTGLMVVYKGDEKSQYFKSMHLYQVCDELCKLLEIEKPNSKGWKRII